MWDKRNKELWVKSMNMNKTADKVLSFLEVLRQLENEFYIYSRMMSEITDYL